MGCASRGASQVKKSGHSETRVTTIVGEIQSGEWLRARQRPLATLSNGLRVELKRFPKSSANRFVGGVLFTIALSEAFESALSEDLRIRDLEEMDAAAKQFLESCVRTSVFFHSNQLNYSHTLEASANQRDAQVSYTDELRHARKKAFAAVQLYQRYLAAAVGTARRRTRGEKRGADENGLFGKIAVAYQDIFNEIPVSTAGGTFSNIVTYIRAYQTNKELKDVKSVERIVRAALKTIRR